MDRCSGELWGARVRIIHHSVSALLSLSDLMMHPMGSVGERERESERWEWETEYLQGESKCKAYVWSFIKHVLHWFHKNVPR